MRYYCELYLSEKLVERKQEILRSLEKGEIQFHQYAIILSENEKNQLEIIESMYLAQKYYREKDLLLVAVVENFEEALNYMEKITQKVYDVTGDADIRTFVINKQKDFEGSKV